MTAKQANDARDNLGSGLTAFQPVHIIEVLTVSRPLQSQELWIYRHFFRFLSKYHFLLLLALLLSVSCLVCYVYN